MELTDSTEPESVALSPDWCTEIFCVTFWKTCERKKNWRTENCPDVRVRNPSIAVEQWSFLDLLIFLLFWWQSERTATCSLCRRQQSREALSFYFLIVDRRELSGERRRTVNQHISSPTGPEPDSVMLSAHVTVSHLQDCVYICTYYVYKIIFLFLLELFFLPFY